MMIHEVTQKAGRHKRRRRIGRGDGSGRGTTAGRGTKGALSRSGATERPEYEGGQTPWFTRIPQRGFSNFAFRKNYTVVNLGQIDKRFEDGAEVTPETLSRSGLVRDARLPVKVLGEGQTSKKLSVTAAKFSRSAAEKINAAGGSVTTQADRR